MSRQFSGALLFLLLLASACGSDPAPQSQAGGGCADDEDCVSGLYCVLGTCTDVLILECTGNADCPTAFCKNGHCAAPVECTDTTQCPLDGVCDPWGICVPNGETKCSKDSHCDDEDPCTKDDCEGGSCSHSSIKNCCTAPADCDDDDPLTTDDCEANVCVNQPLTAPCTGNEDCDDQNLCTDDQCDDEQCTNAAIADCCYGLGDCDDQDPNTIDSCVNNQCEHVDKPDTCTGNPDCVDDDNCTVDLCDDQNGPENAVCVHLPSADPFCCNSKEDCDDSNVMTIDSCVLGSCKNLTLSCNGDGECNDNNSCTTDKCLDKQCVNTKLINDACRCAANSDCIGKGGVCGLVANSELFGTWCMSPQGPLQGAAVCSASDECRSGFCVDYAEGDDLCFQACKDATGCSINEICGTISFQVGEEVIPLKACLPGPDFCGGDKDCKDGDMCFPIDDPTTPGHIIGICDLKEMGLKGAGKVCTLNTDCQSGVCIAPIGKTAKICWSMCSNDEDCAAGLFCYPSFLYFTYEQDTPADPTDDTLFAPGSCLPYAGTYTTCVGDGDCPANEFCYWAKNDTASALMPRCLLPLGTGDGTGGAACTVGSQCRSNICLEGPGLCLGLCSGNDDCTNGTSCKSMAVFSVDEHGTLDPDDDQMVAWTFCQP